MKRICILACAVSVLLLLLSVPVSAHSGKTDASGGHYDSSTGEYHYHHGYPAHQHTNGKCPYDYKDKTNHSSGGSTSSSSSGCNDSGSVFPVLFGVFCIGSVFGFIIFICVVSSKPHNQSNPSPKFSSANLSPQETQNNPSRQYPCDSIVKPTGVADFNTRIELPPTNSQVAITQWKIDLVASIQKAWDSIHDLKTSLDLPIIQNNFDIHLAAMLNGLSRIVMYEQLSFLKLDEKEKYEIMDIIDSHFLKTVDKPDNYFYFSCSDFYQNSFPVWFKDKSAHSYWYDDNFRLEYENNQNKPLMRTIYSVLASFGDIILSEQLSSEYDLLDAYFHFNYHDIKFTKNYIESFRNDFMIPVTKIVCDYFDVCWDNMECFFEAKGSL